MNRLYLIIIIGIVSLSSLSSANDSKLTNPYVPSYPFKSAVIYYTGMNEYGHGKSFQSKEVLYIQGDKLAKVTKMTVPDPKAKGKTKYIETLQIFDPDYVYMVNLTDKIGTKIENSNKYTIQAYDKLSDKEKEAFHKRMDLRGITSPDLPGLGKKIGTDTILGKQCDVYESGKKVNGEELLNMVESGDVGNYFYKKSWIWRDSNIPLKELTNTFGQSNEITATKIEENVKIPDNQFKVNSKIKVTFDEEKSEFSKKDAMARFNHFKTGNPIVLRMKLKEKKLPGKANPVTSDATQKSNQSQD